MARLFMLWRNEAEHLVDVLETQVDPLSLDIAANLRREFGMATREEQAEWEKQQTVSHGT